MLEQNLMNESNNDLKVDSKDNIIVNVPSRDRGITKFNFR